MSTTSDLATGRSIAGAIVQAIGRAMMRWWSAYTTWRIERWAIGRLQAMSDSQLTDIGLRRSQIEFAVKGATVRDSRRH